MTKITSEAKERKPNMEKGTPQKGTALQMEDEEDNDEVEIFHRKPVIYSLAVIEAIIFGFSFIGTKTALLKLAPIEVLATRWTVAFLLFLVLLLTKAMKVDYKGKALKLLILTAFIQPCCYSICEVWGINLTTTSESAIITALVPIAVTMISALVLKVKIGGLSTFAICLAFAGVLCTVVFGEDFSIGGKLAGYILLMLTVIAGAVFTVASNRIADRFTAMEVTFAMALEGAVFFNLIAFVKGYGFRSYVICLKDVNTGLSILFLGVGCSFLCYLIFNVVVSKMPAHQASALQINLITLVGVLTGITIQGDPYGWYTFVGFALIVAGILIVNRKEPCKEE